MRRIFSMFGIFALLLCVSLAMNSALPSFALAEEEYYEEEFVEEEFSEPDPTEPPTPKPTEAPTPKPTEPPTPEPTKAPTPEPTAPPTPEPTAAPTQAPTEAPTAAPTPTPTAKPTEAPKEKEVFEHGYATLRIDADVYEDSSLNSKKYIGRFVEADALVYCLARAEGKKDDVMLITFAVKRRGELELLEGWIRAWNVFPVRERDLKALDKKIREDDYALYDEDENGEDEKDVALPATPFLTEAELNAAAATEAPAAEAEPEETEVPQEETPAEPEAVQQGQPETDSTPAERGESSGESTQTEAETQAEGEGAATENTQTEVETQAEEVVSADESVPADGDGSGEARDAETVEFPIEAAETNAPADEAVPAEEGNAAAPESAIENEGVPADGNVTAADDVPAVDQVPEAGNESATPDAPHGDDAPVNLPEENAPATENPDQIVPEDEGTPAADSSAAEEGIEPSEDVSTTAADSADGSESLPDGTVVRDTPADTTASETPSASETPAGESTPVEEIIPTEENVPVDNASSSADAQPFEEDDTILEVVPGDESFLTEEDLLAHSQSGEPAQLPAEEETLDPAGYFDDKPVLPDAVAAEGEDSAAAETETGSEEETGKEETEYQPATFTPRVALIAKNGNGEGLEARSFTLSADRYNPEGAELGETNQVTLNPGEETSFDEITFTEAGSYGFAIKEDEQETFPWELTVVVGENPNMEQLYIDTTQTVYARADNLNLTNDAAAEFELVPRAPSRPEIEFNVRKTITASETQGDGKTYLPIKTVPATVFTLKRPSGATNTASIPAMPVGTTSGSAALSKVSLDPGKYTYTVTENAGTSAFIKYDSTVHTITIEVSETDSNGDGVYDYTITSSAEVDDIIGNRVYASFYNQYVTVPLTVKLAVTMPITDDPSFNVRVNTDVPGTLPDGESSQSMTFTMKDGDEKIIYGLPVGTKYEVIGESAEGYTVSYDPGSKGETTTDEGTAKNQVLVNYLGRDSASVDLDTWLLLYGYPYKDDNTNTYYYYPNTGTYFKIELVPPEDAPASQQTRTNRAVFAYSGPKRTNQYRSLRIPFNGITFTTEETLAGIHRDAEGKIVDADGNEVSVTEPEFDGDGNLIGRTYIYTVRQTDEIYGYINYDINKQYQTTKEYKVYIRVHMDSSGRLQADIEPVGTSTDVPMFEDEYRATSLSVAKSVSGTGASATQEFRVKITLERRATEADEGSETAPDSDEWVPLRNWQFVGAYGTITTTTNSTGGTNTQRKFAGYRNYRTASDGSISFNLKHRDYVMLHGLPDGIRYSIEEADYESSHYWPRYSVSVGSKSKGRYNEIINIEADGQRIINCVILNLYSLVPITGHGDPARKTWAMVFCLAIALACEAGRRKLRRKERDDG